ncbi:MAG TPA: hypothetical protein P5186_20560 [Candidatus Paceibacterota bacterium]|nr:hypothetical protein [Verrucomicrobiota bacterium]HRY50452.1 hypothetical protein [Candidatus Paceibacterota bacterium]HRZ99758.1 hypothetical protein [Candidatus Paceibacterota bacterium]
MNSLDLICRMGLIAALGGMALAGCGQKTDEAIAEKAAEKAIAKQTGGPADVDLKEDGVRIKTKDGEMNFSSGGNLQVPAKFPSDVLVYPGAKLQTAIEIPEGFSLRLTTKDPVAKVVETYLKELPAQQWSKEMSMDMGSNSMLAFKKENRTVNVVVSSEDNETSVSLTVVTEKKSE